MIIHSSFPLVVALRRGKLAVHPDGKAATALVDKGINDAGLEEDGPCFALPTGNNGNNILYLLVSQKSIFMCCSAETYQWITNGPLLCCLLYALAWPQWLNILFQIEHVWTSLISIFLLHVAFSRIFWSNISETSFVISAKIETVFISAE